MQIACPQCSMTYLLDEALLPPGGAPVQCTQCNHVFTAYPPPAEAQDAGAGQGTASARTPGAQAGGAPARKSTQLFGAATPEAPPARRSTQLFGTGSPEAAVGRTVTDPFGAVPAAARRTGTALMGAVTPEAPPPAPRASTQAFGVVLPAEDAPPARTGAQTFGAALPAEERPPARASTQLFGAAQGEPAAEAPRRASTQMFGAALPAREAPPARTGTQTFGAVAGEPRAEAPRRASTQMFGAVQGEPPAEEGPPARASTHVFGALSAPPPADPAATSAAAGAALPPQPPAGRKATQLFAAPADAHPAQEGAAAPAQAASPEPAGARPQQVRVRIALPSAPEALDVGEERRAASPASRLPEASTSRRRLLLGVGGALAAGLLALGAWRALAPRTYEPPAEAQLARDGAGRLVRRDDLASREKALAELDALVAAEPRFLEARADLVVALALQLDDVKLLLREADATRAELTQQVARLEAAQQPGDWQNRVNALREQLAGLEQRTAALAPKLAPLEGRLQRALEGLTGAEGTLPPAQAQAVVRAQAVEQAVRGSPQVVALSERYRQLGATDGWGDVAYAEYVANAPAGRAGLEPAREALRTLKEQDPSFVRLFVLDARLAHLVGDTEAARSDLEAVLVLNPEHTLARQLLERVQAEALTDGQ